MAKTYSPNPTLAAPWSSSSPEANRGRWISGSAVASILVHAVVVFALGRFIQVMPDDAAVYAFLVPEPAPPEVSPPEEPLEEPPEEPQPLPEEKPRPRPREPQRPPPPPPESGPPPRRMIDIDMSSTVTTGDGPLINVGPGREGSLRGTAAGKGRGAQGDGSGAAANRAAVSVPVATSRLDRPRRLGTSTQPGYPPELRARGIEGNVVVTIDIDPSGVVTGVKIIQSSGYPEFDEEAVRAARQDSYAPAARDGKPVSYTLKYTYRFRIRGV